MQSSSATPHVVAPAAVNDAVDSEFGPLLRRVGAAVGDEFCLVAVVVVVVRLGLGLSPFDGAVFSSLRTSVATGVVGGAVETSGGGDDSGTSANRSDVLARLGGIFLSVLVIVTGAALWIEAVKLNEIGVVLRIRVGLVANDDATEEGDPEAHAAVLFTGMDAGILAAAGHGGSASLWFRFWF